jgi:RNA polymerase sigma factor (sigma-70 family)
MYNPFAEKIDLAENDLLLIEQILGGSSKDLELLVFRHQAWIYNIALKMVMDPGEAEDITQEILIKIVTKLSTFDPDKSAFRTWLYRIVANHVINMKKQKNEFIFRSFQVCESEIEKIPDETIMVSPETTVLIEELKIKCWTGMLLCLNRKHRLVFILGEIFEVKDELGSQIMDISRVNYRKILSRARKKLYNFMNHNCGLINKKNPCHCEYKLNGFIRNGFIQPDNIQHFREKAQKIIEAVQKSIDDVREYDDVEKVRMFKEHPFYDPPGFDQWISNLFENGKFVNL